MKICTLLGGPCPVACSNGVDTALVEQLLRERPTVKALELWTRFEHLVNRIMANGKALLEIALQLRKHIRSPIEILTEQRSLGAQLMELQAEIRFEIAEGNRLAVWTFGLAPTSLDDHRFHAKDRREKPLNQALIVSIRTKVKSAAKPADKLSDRIVMFTRRGGKRRVKHNPRRSADVKRSGKRGSVIAHRNIRPPAMKRMVVTVSS